MSSPFHLLKRTPRDRNNISGESLNKRPEPHKRSFNNSSFLEEQRPARSSSQNSNILSSFIAQAFNPKQSTTTRPASKMEEENRQEEYRQREMKYLMRIATLEKDVQKKQETLHRLKKENQQIENVRQLERKLQDLKEQLQSSKSENCMLKKHLEKSEKKSVNRPPSFMIALNMPCY